MTSCASTRSTSAVNHPKKYTKSDEPKFLENIAIKPGSGQAKTIEKPIDDSKNVPAPLYASGMPYSTDIEKCSYLQFKYAILMEEPVESVTNEKLIGFLEDWYGAPYRYGGVDKKGY